MARRVQVRVEQNDAGQWIASCREDECTWVQTPGEKTYTEQRARAHRAYHRKAAERG